MPTEAQSRGDHLSVSLAMSIYKLKHETSSGTSLRDAMTISCEKFVIRLRCMFHFSSIVGNWLLRGLVYLIDKKWRRLA